ncbi:MAG: hypothetical protein ACM3S5_05725, partial [Rhodospirillales bacterium]
EGAHRRIPAAEHGVFPPRFPALFRRKYSYVEGSGAADEHFFNKVLEYAGKEYGVRLRTLYESIGKTK